MDVHQRHREVACSGRSCEFWAAIRNNEGDAPIALGRSLEMVLKVRERQRTGSIVQQCHVRIKRTEAYKCNSRVYSKGQSGHLWGLGVGAGNVAGRGALQG